MPYSMGSIERLISSEPSPEEYAEYAAELERWIKEVEGLLVLDFALSNTGQSVAEDVEVVLEVPAILQPTDELPEKPSRPTGRSIGHTLSMSAYSDSSSDLDQYLPGGLSGPYIKPPRESKVEISWEIDKLYHGRTALVTHSGEDYVEGILLPAETYKVALEEASGKVQLPYTIYAANLKSQVRGNLVLK